MRKKQRGFLLNPFRMVPPPAPGDPYFASTNLLLHLDGADNSVSILDSSPANRTLACNGNAKISTANYKFGVSSLFLDGAGDFVSSPYSTAFNVAGDFTVEAWVFSTTSAGRCIVSNRNVGNINFHLFLGTYLALDTIPSGGTVSIVGTTVAAINTWHHVRATKSGNTWRIFLNGNLEASGTVSGVYTPTGVPLIIGASAANYYWSGYIDDFRLTSGVCRSTASFTLPTAAFPNYQELA